MAETSPAFKLYPKDYLSSSRVAVLSLAQEGAYFRLLMHQWLDGSIPGEITKLAILCRTSPREMKKLWDGGLSDCFEPAEMPGRLQNPRLEYERRKQKEYREGRRAAGQEGARKRWNGQPSDSRAMAEPSRVDGSAMADPSAVATSVPLADDSFAVCGLQVAFAETEQAPSVLRVRAGEDEFRWQGALAEAVRKAYPPHRWEEFRDFRALFDALRRGQIVADGQTEGPRTITAENFLSRVKAWATCDQWTREGGRYAKNFENFVKDGTFLSEPPSKIAAAVLPSGTTPSHLEAARLFDEEAGL